MRRNSPTIRMKTGPPDLMLVGQPKLFFFTSSLPPYQCWKLSKLITDNFVGSVQTAQRPGR